MAQVVVLTQRTPAPAYNTVAVSRDHAGLQQRRTTCPSAPAYNTTAGSSDYAASDFTVVFTVRLSRPGLHQHTGPYFFWMSCLLSMSKSLLGKPGFLPTNWRQIIIYYQPPSALDGSMGKCTSRRHYSLVNFKSPVGRNHWPSC